MPTYERKNSVVRTLQAGVLLLITDPVRDKLEVLEFACALAEKHGASLELAHVIDLGNPSMPNVQTGIQHKLEALARTLRSLNRSTQAILLFGKPEHVVAERAEEIKATLIAITLNGSANDRVQKRIAEALSRRSDRPVLTLSPETGVEGSQMVRFQATWYKDLAH